MKNNLPCITAQQLYLLKQIKLRSHIGIPIFAYINGEFPELITFQIDDDQMKTVEFYIDGGRYSTLADLYSANFVRAILSFFEVEGEYEECRIIVNQLEERNRIMRLSVPTTPYEGKFQKSN